jgi:hypothetical protein
MPAPNISDAAAAIRTWLMKSPRPKSLRVYGKDGREYDITIKPNSAWAETASSICSLDPERIEANGEDEKLVRACVVAALVQAEQKEVQQTAAVSAAMQSADPETQRLIVFAELLARSAERAIEMVERTTGSAFDRMQGICDALAAQASAAQQSANDLTVGIRNLLIQQAQDVVDQATNREESPLEKLAGNFLAGAEMGKAENAAAQVAAEKTNGKH